MCIWDVQLYSWEELLLFSGLYFHTFKCVYGMLNYSHRTYFVIVLKFLLRFSSMVFFWSIFKIHQDVFSLLKCTNGMYYYRYKTHFKFWRVLTVGFFPQLFFFIKQDVFSMKMFMWEYYCSRRTCFFIPLKFLRDWTVVLNFYLDST
jgi:hypothetical protein